MFMRVGLEKEDIEIPLILENNIVKRDCKSWQWMVNQYGCLRMPFTSKRPPEEISDWEYFDGIKFRGNQELRYHLHNYYPSAKIDRDFNDSKFDPIKYMGTHCGLHMYQPLNFN